MAKKSAGILLYRAVNAETEVFLVHPGGPFFVKKDTSAWSIPKGEFLEEEDPLVAAKREFHEETGVVLTGKFTALTPIRQKGGKTVYAWAVEGNINEKEVRSNVFKMEWPPRSGKMAEFPEIDKAGWFTLPVAKEKILPAQVLLIDELEKVISG